MVLIVCSTKKEATCLSEIFYYMGIVSYGTTYYQGLGEVSPMYRAVIMLFPEKFADIRDYIDRVRTYSSVIPIFGVTDNRDQIGRYEKYFSAIYKYSTLSAHLASKMAEYCRSQNQPHIGDYRLAAINATADRDEVEFFGIPIELTKSEKMILRFLMRAYPNPMKSPKILKYAFRQSRVPEQSTVRAHISGINRKYREKFGRNIIMMLPHEGYVILTPMLVKERNLQIEL